MEQGSNRGRVTGPRGVGTKIDKLHVLENFGDFSEKLSKIPLSTRYLGTF